MTIGTKTAYTAARRREVQRRERPVDMLVATFVEDGRSKVTNYVENFPSRILKLGVGEDMIVMGFRDSQERLSIQRALKEEITAVIGNNAEYTGRKYNFKINERNLVVDRVA